MSPFFRVNGEGRAHPTLLGKVTTGVAAVLSTRLLAFSGAEVLNPAPLPACSKPIAAVAPTDFVYGTDIRMVTDNTALGNRSYHARIPRHRRALQSAAD